MKSLNPIWHFTYVSIIIFAFLISSIDLFAQPSTPTFQTFQPITIQNSSAQFGNNDNPVFRSNPILPNNSIEQQNRKILLQSGMTLPGPSPNNRQQQLAELRAIVKEEERNNKIAPNEVAGLNAYLSKLREFLQMNPDNFSLTKAVYLTESAWYNNPPSYEEFNADIKQLSSLVKEMLRRQGLPSNNSMAVNYGIQQLYNRTSKVPILSYDFDDYLGEKNWSSMFVTKLLKSGKGQCHSMPLLYLCIAEQLKAKAWLSLAPNHSFIQFFDSKGNRYNFECTNGSLVTQSLLMQSVFINATAIKNNTYLDTLSSRQLYAQCLGDLLLGFTTKFNDDQTSEELTARILAIDPNNIVALMTQANLNTFRASQLRMQAGNPSLSDISNYPEINAAYQKRDASYRRIEATGFQSMPKELYERWLKSIEQEKNQESEREEQEKINREIEQLKKMKPKIINKPKG